MLQTLPNTTNGTLMEEHTLTIPPCCPVSKNPVKASITIRYMPMGQSLEVGSLLAYIHSFRGGLKDELGNIVVRDMEGMIMRIREDCEQVLGVSVEIDTTWDVLPRQTVHMHTKGAA
jgi:NADPH-dependent 7-cyano-7-deazaguanine reductase QueF